MILILPAEMRYSVSDFTLQLRFHTIYVCKHQGAQRDDCIPSKQPLQFASKVFLIPECAHYDSLKSAPFLTEL